MYINPTSETHPREKLDIIKRESSLVSKDAFIKHTPGKRKEFGVCLVVFPEAVLAKVATTIQEIEILTGDKIEEPRYYLILRLDQITKLDPYCGQQLEILFPE